MTTRLLDLPPELLINIYEQLENIDDALHLARSCRLMYAVLDAPGRRLSIFSHIIVSSFQLNFFHGLKEGLP